MTDQMLIKGAGLCFLSTPYSAHMSPENTHKLMGFYIALLILGIVLYMVSASLSRVYRVNPKYNNMPLYDITLHHDNI